MSRKRSLAWTAAVVGFVVLSLQLFVLAYTGFNLYGNLAWYFPELPFPDLDMSVWAVLDFIWALGIFAFVVYPFLRRGRR